jgi:hypothetical protein
MAQLYTDIVKLLEQAKSDIQSSMAANGINASGRTSDSFHVVEADGHIMLVMGGDGTAPLATLEIGRAGGKIPYNFQEILMEWSRNKGISFPDERMRKDFAWFLSQRIKDKGTLRHQTPVDVYSTIVHDTVEQLKPAIVKAVKDNFLHKRKP